MVEEPGLGSRGQHRPAQPDADSSNVGQGTPLLDGDDIRALERLILNESHDLVPEIRGILTFKQQSVLSVANVPRDAGRTRALLAREAWKKELYSEGQLARLLQLNRHGIREVLDGAETEEREADDLVRIPR